MYNNPDTGLDVSGPLTEGLTWGKVMYSTILTDLGQPHLQNLLQDESLLQWALQYPDDVFRKSMDDVSCDYDADQNCDYDWMNYGGIASPLEAPTAGGHAQTPMNQSYDAYKTFMGPLGTKNATIFSQYACSVPVRKSFGSLFLAVLVANLVFLSALWTLLNAVAGTIVKRHDREAMACRAHIRNAYGAVAMGPMGPRFESRKHLVRSSNDDLSDGSDLIGREGYRLVS
ncbi:hypothetical protein LTR70_001748 [Exophiala xenobiotica]|uniref:Uncharacterized protein n=1 Tax=Lithohypha guttulata TaxID=1690604 RepID=A0ABR0KMB6_9EURO|nr:hypothetical protein LTR24_001059 [Lithohypha guttulata]KAK5327006.1 hypothetical protein LTR70_001748 [Exophiala xenobiotica]